MDDDIIEILGNNPTNATIKTIYDGDVQEPQSQRDLIIEIENFKFTISKILFINNIEPLLDMTAYVKIEGLIYKVLKIKTFSDYMEIDLYKLKRQVS